MDWDIVAPMGVAVVFILTAGGVLLLRPISRRLAHLLQAMANERQEGMTGNVARLRDEIDTLQKRIDLLEDRQDFTEALIESDASKAKGRLTE